MLYRILRIITRLGLLGYYRKIYIRQETLIPVDRPVILAANHPNAFTEPLLMACFSGRILHFITRSDVFHPMLKWFFNGTHQIPIFRFADQASFKKLRNNQQTFSKCYEVLAKNGAILIFSEGSTKLGKTVRPLQKGTAKMAFGLLDAYPDLEPVILPVGFTYSRPIHWNGDVMINMGSPIDVKSYYNKGNHINEDIEGINKAIKSQLDRLAIHVDAPDNEVLQEGLAHMARRREDTSLLPLIRYKDVFTQELNWSRMLNQRKITSQVSDKWKAFESIVDEENIDHQDFVVGDVSWTKVLILIVVAPIALIGLTLCSIPMLLTSLYVKKMVQSVMFTSGIKIGMGTFASLFVALMITICILYYYGWIGVLALPILVWMMLIGIKWLSLYKSVGAFLKFKISSRKKEITSLSHELISAVLKE